MQQKMTVRRIAGALMVLLGAALTVTGLLGATLTARLDRFPLEPTSIGPGRSYLLLGSDSREGQKDEIAAQLGLPDSVGDRADVLLLVRVPPAGPAQTVSIPRDLMVTDDEGFPQPVALTLLDGPDATARALCRTLEVGVDGVVVVNASALVSVVDALGGIPVELPYAVRDEQAHLDLPAGQQQLDGMQVFALARSRQPQHYLDGRWVAMDEADGARWRATTAGMLAAEGSRALKQASWPRLIAVAWAASGEVAVDEDLGMRDLILMATGASNPETLPVSAYGSRAVVADDAGHAFLEEAGFSGCVLPVE